MATKFLNNITINDAYTFPASDGTDGQVMTTDGAGALSFTTVGDGEAVKIHVKNTSGATIAKGQPVYVTGNVGNSDRLEVSLANASDSTKMPAVGLLESDLIDDGEGDVIVTGFLKTIDTTVIDGSNGGSGDVVYVKPGGGLTYTKPTGTNLIQNIAKVGRDHSNGSLVVTSIMRTNDVPNIAENYVWLGNSSGVATATEHILENVKDVTTTTPTDGQVLTWDNANSYWKNADATGGGGGGSETGTVTIQRDVFDGTHATDPTDGTNTTFDISSTIVGENNIQVYLDGVYQSKDNYTTSGTTITFTPAPPANTELEIIHVKAITGQITVDKFDGTGSKVAFVMTKAIDNENNLQVYINGVYQSKDNFSTSGSTITFSTAPANNTKIEVVHLKAVDVTSVGADLFTGNGTQTAFDLESTPSGSAKTLVFIQGVYQEKSAYSLSGNTIAFTTPPPDGYTIEVTSFGKLAVSESTVNVQRFTGDNSETDFVISDTPSANNLDVYISGLYQNKNSYTYSSGTITFSEAPETGVVIEAKYIGNITQVVAADNDFYKFQWVPTIQTADFTAVANRGYFVDTSSSAITATLPASPNVGDTVTLVDYSSSAATNNINITSSNNIMGSSTDKAINYENGAVDVVFSGSTKGWLATSAANETNEALLATILNVDYLVVAGGGGGNEGGGGAGGLRTSYTNTSSLNGHSETILTLDVSTDYTVSVGAGGAGGVVGTGGVASATSGGNSTFATIQATGGGYGGGRSSVVFNGASGGSGGGGRRDGTTPGGAAVTSPAVQGYAGGTSPSGPWIGGGGGGGANQIGQSGSGGSESAETGGDGGNGLEVNITSGNGNIYAGGGGGGAEGTGGLGTGGTGGGGTGGGRYVGTPSSGSPNTGGGGGGSSKYANSPGSGGSGVVILRYPASYTIAETTSPAVLTFTTDNTSVSGVSITTFTGGSNGTIQFS